MWPFHLPEVNSQTKKATKHFQLYHNSSEVLYQNQKSYNTSTALMYPIYIIIYKLKLLLQWEQRKKPSLSELNLPYTVQKHLPSAAETLHFIPELKILSPQAKRRAFNNITLVYF